MHIVFSVFDHTLNHLAADPACIAGGNIAVIALICVLKRTLYNHVHETSVLISHSSPYPKHSSSEIISCVGISTEPVLCNHSTPYVPDFRNTRHNPFFCGIRLESMVFSRKSFLEFEFP